MVPEIPIDPAPLAIYDFLQVNGFVYRCNKVTGEMWQLSPSVSDRKAQVWKKIHDAQPMIEAS